MAPEHVKTMTTLASSYNEEIRPLLDAIDRLRHLNVMQEGIELPTIVVVGDQSSGKSSVLESLAGISLPRGQGICTRVPLVMRLQNHPSIDYPQLNLVYGEKSIATTEEDITAAISAATDEIAGNGKGISNTPLTLLVKKRGVPDLTMIDLPGITRVPVHGQPENIYEQISNIIMEYINPKASIILNVLSASVDFPTCESIRMSQQVDRTGERTLAVVTKADKSPEGLFEKVNANDVKIGLGYVCVRNRIGDESYEQARVEEAALFDEHPLLSKIDKSIVGVPVLAQKLMQIQAASIAQCLPSIVRKINEKLNRHINEVNQLPQNLKSVADAMRAFMHMLNSTKETMLNSTKETLRKILIRGEFEEFNDDASMHGTARLAEMLNSYYKELPSSCPFTEEKFLMEEIEVLLETQGIGLPNFLPRTAFLTILRRKIGQIAHTPHDFVSKVWGYVEEVVIRVLVRECGNYPQLQLPTRRAALNLMQKMSGRSYEFVNEVIEMELNADYTSNPDYMKTWSGWMQQLDGFRSTLQNIIVDIQQLDGFSSTPQNITKSTRMNLQGIGAVDVGHLRKHVGIAEQAFDMRMRMLAYWKTVVLRLVDGLALHILHSIRNLVEKEMEVEMVNQLMGAKGTGVEGMLGESPSTTAKRERLTKSIELLEQSKEAVAKIMDRITVHCQ